MGAFRDYLRMMMGWWGGVFPRGGLVCAESGLRPSVLGESGLRPRVLASSGLRPTMLGESGLEEC